MIMYIVYTDRVTGVAVVVSMVSDCQSLAQLDNGDNWGAIVPGGCNCGDNVTLLCLVYTYQKPLLQARTHDFIQIESFIEFY